MFQKLITIFRTSVVQFQNLRDICSTFGDIPATILKVADFFYFVLKKPLLKTVKLKVPAENYRSENVNCRSKYNCDHQSNQIKLRKFYEYFSGYANFSKSSHKGHKTKGHIL